jgi:ArsR family transcriptional regulator
MKALSDPNRVRVLKLLQDKELCVCNIQAFLHLAQSTVSRHMKVLEDAGLVEHRRQGTWIMYRLTEKHESEYAATILPHLEHWLEDDKELKQMRLQRDLIISKEAHCAV